MVCLGHASTSARTRIQTPPNRQYLRACDAFKRHTARTVYRLIGWCAILIMTLTQGRLQQFGAPVRDEKVRPNSF
jgi:hypothetical protein